MPMPMSLIFLPPEAAPMVTKPTCFCLLIPLPLLERGVERDAGGSEVGPANQCQCVGRTPVSVYARVLPFDRQRAVVSDSVQGADQRFEVNVAVARRDEGPTAIRLAEVDVRAEDRAVSVEKLLRVLDVDVVNAIRELHHERRRVEELVRKMARVEVDAEPGPVPDRGQRLARGDEVVCDLGWMHLQAEADALLVEDVDDRVPARGEVGIASLDLGPVVGRKRVQHVPRLRAGEAVDLLHAESRRGASGVHHLSSRPLAHAFGIAVAPHVGGQDAFVPVVDRVANSLADQVIRDRPALEAVALEDLPTSLDITWIGQGLVDLEVVTPAGELQPVESPGGRLARERVESQIGPLAGEQSHRTSHPRTSSSAVT